MLILNRSTQPFLYRWYAVAARCLTPGSAPIVAKNLLTNGDLHFVSIYSGMSLRMVQWSIKRFATCVNVIFNIGIANINLEQ